MSRGTKEQDERHQAILNEMLKEEANRFCADCKLKGPRWASVNLGVFICIRCSGIHRSLGTHISKVKSVNLDSWQPDQIRSMENWGNARAAEVWEATLPADYKRPGEHDSYAAENFIKAKYVRGQWKAKDGEVRPREEPRREESRREEPRSQTRAEPSQQRFPKVASATASSPAKASPAAPKQPEPVVDLLSLSDPTPAPAVTPQATPSSSDPFGDFHSTSAFGGAQQQQQQGGSILGSVSGVATQDTTTTKDSILAMYAQPQGGFMQPRPMVAPQAGFQPNYDVSMGPRRPMAPMPGMPGMPGMYPAAPMPMGYPGMAPPMQWGMGAPMGGAPMGGMPMQQPQWGMGAPMQQQPQQWGMMPSQPQPQQPKWP